MSAGDPALRRKGYLITLLGVLWLSPDALILRLIDADAFSILGWRGGLSFLVLGAFLLWRDSVAAPRRIQQQGWRVWLVGVLYALNSGAFVFAIEMSSVADVLVIIAATPLFAALFGWLLLREIPSATTSLAIVLGAVGVGIAAAGGVTGGAGLGMVFALLTVIMLAMQFTLLRLWPHVDNIGAIFVGSMLLAIASFAFAAPLSIEGWSLFWAFVLGLALTPIAFTLVTVGPRYLTGAEVSLMMLLETAFGPIWVWLALGETPARTAFIGGAVIILAVMITASSAFRRQS